jgi:ribokinase
MSADVIVVGSVNVDLVIRVARLPQVGETVGDGRFVRRRGGKGANQAVAAARLGARVRIVGAVGDDGDGELVRAGLVKEGVDCSLLAVRPGTATGTAVILVDEIGRNIIAVAAGANAQVALPDGFAEVLAADPGLLLGSLEVPYPVVAQAAAAAIAAGWQVIVNPAPAPVHDVTWPTGAVLTPNERELHSLTGEDDVATGVRVLATASGCCVVATVGERGAVTCAEGDVNEVPGVPAQCIDTTGAGDAFNGALATALARGLDLVDAVEVANTAAAASTEVEGAQEGLLTLEALRDRLRRPLLM